MSTPAPTPPRCPECVQGKHGNCDGETWDFDIDTTTPCRCVDRHHLNAWHHNRKGSIVGRELRRSKDGTWVHILLTEPATGIVNEWGAGEVLTVRATFLTRLDDLT